MRTTKVNTASATVRAMDIRKALANKAIAERAHAAHAHRIDKIHFASVAGVISRETYKN